jgi:hypothetical protein
VGIHPSMITRVDLGQREPHIGYLFH